MLLCSVGLLELYCGLFNSSSKSINRVLVNRVIHMVVQGCCTQTDACNNTLFSFFSKALLNARWKPYHPFRNLLNWLCLLLPTRILLFIIIKNTSILDRWKPNAQLIPLGRRNTWPFWSTSSRLSTYSWGTRLWTAGWGCVTWERSFCHPYCTSGQIRGPVLLSKRRSWSSSICRCVFITPKEPRLRTQVEWLFFFPLKQCVYYARL